MSKIRNEFYDALYDIYSDLVKLGRNNLTEFYEFRELMGEYTNTNGSSFKELKEISRVYEISKRVLDQLNTHSVPEALAMRNKFETLAKTSEVAIERESIQPLLKDKIEAIATSLLTINTAIHSANSDLDEEFRWSMKSSRIHGELRGIIKKRFLGKVTLHELLQYLRGFESYSLSYSGGVSKLDFYEKLDEFDVAVLLDCLDRSIIKNEDTEMSKAHE